jgi:hypothetical protein
MDGTDPRDIPGDVTWMSYAELGQLRGISAASAKRLSNRRRWAKRVGNDGTSRVAVPAAEAEPRETDTRDVPGDVSHLIARAERAEERADEANKRADVAVALADRTLAQLAEANTATGKLRDRLDAALDRAEIAERALEQRRQAEEQRRGQALWPRLRAAWRGERWARAV